MAEHPETLVVHPRPATGHAPVVPPIHQSATWRLDDAKQGADFAQQSGPAEFYHRWGNPTTRLLEETLAQLEGGEAALCTASGMGAISTAILTAVQGQHHIAAQRTLYSATSEMLTDMLPAFGVRHAFWNPADPGALKAALERDTKLVYIETPANPTLEVTDIAHVAKVAHEAGAMVVCDNTFATPLNQQPLALGCDAVVHSMTKGLGGHSDVSGGAIVGTRAFIERCWHNFKILGPSLSPHDAFLVQRGVKTLALRVQRQNENALALARWLEGQPAVRRVNHPGLAAHPQHALARRQMRGFGCMLSFELGGKEQARRFVEAVRVATLAVSLGGVETLVQHPASMTHGPLSDADRARSGIGEGLVRVSVGIEHVEDLQRDFAQALRA
ncbi:MAG: PLP-dependent aspartate aminotransferase family protein [Halobacteriales archaeon]|nr:PLP-dependent aspartate aminotransferase family protein [Halobacteriales archaeon]